MFHQEASVETIKLKDISVWGKSLMPFTINALLFKIFEYVGVESAPGIFKPKTLFSNDCSNTMS